MSNSNLWPPYLVARSVKVWGALSFYRQFMASALRSFLHGPVRMDLDGLWTSRGWFAGRKKHILGGGFPMVSPWLFWPSLAFQIGKASSFEEIQAKLHRRGREIRGFGMPGDGHQWQRCIKWASVRIVDLLGPPSAGSISCIERGRTCKWLGVGDIITIWDLQHFGSFHTTSNRKNHEHRREDDLICNSKVRVFAIFNLYIFVSLISEHDDGRLRWEIHLHILCSHQFPWAIDG